TAPISTPTLISIEKRWDHMSTVEQDDIVGQLAERQKGAWGELTLAEKQAAWYISYGAWGPRKPIHPEGEISKILMGVTAGVVATIVLFAGVRMFADEMPVTMSREWQEASDKILASHNANPFSNYSQVQS
ncbi:cytochrome c oxidase subunit IV, partial [Nadsonia fulvescens var. elongata DSM 6958]